MKTIAALLLLFATSSLFAADVEISASALTGTNHHFATLTPSEWRLQAGVGVSVGAHWFATKHVSFDLESGVEQQRALVVGNRVERFRSLPMSLMLQVHESSRSLMPYAGAGISYLLYRGVTTITAGQPAQPDHPAIVVGAGTDYVLSTRWKLNFDMKYGPARSTAEVNRAGGVEKIDFHQLYVSTGLKYHF
ncbi:MAG TPA: OmpW family outer membrane protein [Thermoanaerobaculia bacterium]